MPLDDENAIPSEAKVEQLEEKLESQQRDLNDLVTVVLRRLIATLSDHIQNCKTQNKSFKNYWFRWTIGRLQQVFFEVSTHFNRGCTYACASVSCEHIRHA